MTREAIRQADPALAGALDRFDPPPLSPDFADRVVAASQARPAAVLPRLRRGAGRGLGTWRRGRHAVLGGAAFLIVGATAAAAATGLFNRVGIDLAPVGQIVERVAATVPGLGPARVAPRPQPSPLEVELAAQEVAATTGAPPLADPRRERLAQALAARIDRRVARAEARGIEVPERFRDTDQRLSLERAATQPERAALVERVQQIRSERRQAASDGAPQASTQASLPEADLEQIAAGWAALSWPERMALVRPLDRSERRRLFMLLTPEQRAELTRLRRQRGGAATGARSF